MKTVNKLFALLALLALLLTVALIPAHAAGIRYATPGVTGTGDCLSWANACLLQTALTGAVSGNEIWVAAGMHKPTTTTDRTATFQLKNGVAVYGGFNGTETARSQRNLAANVTILSGDLNGDDVGFTNNSENIYHVVTGATGATLDGFTITAGNANGASDPSWNGGGMYNNVGSPTLANVIFNGNSAVKFGGGVYNYDSRPRLTNVIFNTNSATDSGGGMYNDDSDPTLTSVTFSGNTAKYGGGMNNWYSSPTLANVTFSGNSAGDGGGGMYNSYSYPTIIESTFNGNTAYYRGGGMVTYYYGNPTLINVTFEDNSATYTTGKGGAIYSFESNLTLTNVTLSGNWALNNGGGMYIVWDGNGSPTLTNVTFNGNTAYNKGGGIYTDYSRLTLTNVTLSNNSAVTGGGMYNSDWSQIRNTIFWGNTATIAGAQIYYDVGSLVVSDSVIQNGCPVGGTCTNIITGNPVLGALGNHGGFTQTIPLLAGSSAIDTGNDAVCPATDQRGIVRPQGAYCDIGAYEVAPPNAAPTDISLSSASVIENMPSGTTVGTLSTMDPDAGDTHTYSFACAIPGADDASFQIGGAGNDELQTAAVFDFETKNSYSICLRTDDGHGGTFDKNFTINVTDVVETLTATFRSTGAQDGWVLESSETSNKGGSLDSAATTFRLGDDNTKKQYRGILSFGTGTVLPDTAFITKVTLKFKKQGIIGGGNPVNAFQGFMVDIKKGTFGTAALQTGDFQTAASKSYGPFMTALGGGWYSIDLTSGKAYINKSDTLSGLTQIRLRFKLDDNSNAIANYLSLYSGNAPAASRPQLIIEYYVQ